MENTNAFLCSIILSNAGFIFAYYGIFAENKIQLITKRGLQKGYSLNNPEHFTFFADKYGKWKAGVMFVSPNILPIGKFICLVAFIFNFCFNPWWTSFIGLLIGYLLYLIMANILGWWVQYVSLFLFTFSFIYAIIIII